MNLREITIDIYYAGVNDRTTTLFESLWKLPYGVSYNSYIIKDKKNVLIDTAHATYSRDLLDNIRLVLGEETLDYLVINHMEPDHSGSISSIIATYPNIKIVGNRQTIAMIKGFYHLEYDNYVEVAKDYELELGDKTLRFYLTPMVHWPETMMTYCPERALLFSGDAFGTFGALNGHIVDTNMDATIYLEEMYRYYACIVGKYGRHVQRALTSLQGLKLDYICSTHGPVWHDKLTTVLDIVDRLSTYQSESGVTIVYGSMYGNTQEVAEAIAMSLAAKGVRNIKVHNVATSDMSNIISDAFRYEGLIVGSPTYSMEIFPMVETFMKAMETREVKNKVFGVFGSFTWASAALKKLTGYAEKLGWEVVSQLEMKQAPTESTFETARVLGEAIASKIKK